MICPVCEGNTKVVDSRKYCDHIYRVRKCLKCGYRFPTTEIDEDVYLRQKKMENEVKKK